MVIKRKRHWHHCNRRIYQINSKMDNIIIYMPSIDDIFRKGLLFKRPSLKGWHRYFVSDVLSWACFFIFGQAQCCSNEIFHWAGMAAMITNIFSQWLYADNTEICVCFGARLHSAPMGLRIILEFVRVDTLKPSGQLYSIFQEWCPYADKVEAFGRPAFFR